MSAKVGKALHDKGHTCWFVEMGQIRQVIARFKDGRVHERGKGGVGIILQCSYRSLDRF